MKTKYEKYQITVIDSKALNDIKALARSGDCRSLEFPGCTSGGVCMSGPAAGCVANVAQNI